MKKGFTLIELLAVILILGIIALIAIPTVNKIINEARLGAFKSGNDNIMKTIEQDCQTSIMKGENPILSYVFTEGKSNAKINVKGSLPNDGYILLDKSCTITDYYLTDNKNVYSNGDDVRKDYMLKHPTADGTSIFKTLYESYYDNLNSVKFISNLDIPQNAIEIKDPSVSGKNKIKSWLVPNEEKYDLYIGSLNKIYANFNSASLFENSTAITFNFENLHTNFVTKFNRAFRNSQFITIDLSSFDMSSVKTISHFFYYCRNAESINVSTWDTKSMEYISAAFQYCNRLKEIDVNKWDVRNVIEAHAFLYNTALTNINISNWNLENINYDHVDSLSYFFSCDSGYIEKDNLTTIYFTNYELKNGNNLIKILQNRDNIHTIYCNNLNNIKLILSLLPNKTSDNIGTIYVIKEIFNSIDENTINTFKNKNWYFKAL